MKELMESWRRYVKLNESGLNRLRKHMMAHDCAILTAFRNDLNDKLFYFMLLE